MPFDNEGNGVALKVGEIPELHIDLPSALPGLLGVDYKFFIKGLNCEKQGFGIGAFAYYRRVVENQKGRFILQIAKVAKMGSWIVRSAISLALVALLVNLYGRFRTVPQLQ